MKTLLLVEDSKEYQELLQDKLHKHYTIIPAYNGKEALEKVEHHAIDLILLDLLMPEEDGVDFYYKLTHVLKKHIPIIVLTNVTDAIGVGDDIKEVLVKANVSLADITEKIHKHLS